ncbi:hypothetical protein [Streptomyces halobius]|uniref:Uncharacterized protein n=1 Tax=Streptomyces halobius TaxID=2879846 RepID=A0ABY4MER6_9ACTN|nr:hypothetical protein [Streptomyces halobius]UQA95234.1 hypothetical protein K9S39_28300 [Streptomyces halobius]
MNPSGARLRTLRTGRAAHTGRSVRSARMDDSVRTVRTARSARAVHAGLAVGLLSGLLGADFTFGTAHASAQGRLHGPAPGRAPVPSAACGRPDSPDFPISSRVHGGPATYSSGGGWQTWQLQLRNTTAAACEDVHPIVVLTDARRALRPERIRLEFRDPADGGWRPVPFESTDHDEQIGVFGKEGKDEAEEKVEGEEKGGGAEKEGRALGTGGRAGGGLTVPGKGTLSVPMRMRFEQGTPADRVTANVTTVQRRGSDGEWIGQSGDYRFDIRPGAPAPAAPMTPAMPGLPSFLGTPPGEPHPSQDPTSSSELAATGRGSLFGLGALFAGLLAGGAVLIATARLLRHRLRR